MRLVVAILLVFTALVSVEFLFAYNNKTRLEGKYVGTWKDHPEGRHVMTFMAVIALVVTVSAMGSVYVLATGSLTPLWFRIIQIVCFVGVPMVILWRRRILTVVQKQGEYRDREEEGRRQG